MRLFLTPCHKDAVINVYLLGPYYFLRIRSEAWGLGKSRGPSKMLPVYWGPAREQYTHTGDDSQNL